MYEHKMLEVVVNDEGTCFSVEFKDGDSVVQTFIVDDNAGKVYVESLPGDWLAGKATPIPEGPFEAFLFTEVARLIAAWEQK